MTWAVYSQQFIHQPATDSTAVIQIKTETLRGFVDNHSATTPVRIPACAVAQHLNFKRLVDGHVAIVRGYIQPAPAKIPQSTNSHQ